MSLRRSTVLLAVLSGAGCHEDEAPQQFGSRTWVGEHLEVWTTEDAEYCEGSFGFLDQHAENLKNLYGGLGIGTAKNRFRYFWLDGSTWQEQEVCDTSFYGCAYAAGDVYVDDTLASHELVHALELQRHHTVFEEGLAEVYGDLQSIPDWMAVAPTLDIPTQFNNHTNAILPGQHYEGAAAFTRVLMELYPEEALPAIQRTASDMDYDAVRTQLSMAGVDLDEVVSFYENTEGCPHDGVRIALTECSTPGTPWNDDGSWERRGILDCSAANTYGPTDDYIWTYHTVDIPQAGPYLVSMNSTQSTFGRFMACNSDQCAAVADNSHLPSRLLVNGLAVSLDLEAKRYWFRLDRALEDGPDPGYALRIEPQ